MYEEIAAIIADVSNIDIASIAHESELRSLGVDSLTVVEALLAIETRFGVKFAAGEIGSQSTVDDIIRSVRVKVAHNV